MKNIRSLEETLYLFFSISTFLYPTRIHNVLILYWVLESTEVYVLEMQICRPFWKSNLIPRTSNEILKLNLIYSNYPTPIRVRLIRKSLNSPTVSLVSTCEFARVKLFTWGYCLGAKIGVSVCVI